jgi:NAD(P)-dependent dehydrogenase (short-subunit alcohol dehydrogenase family)
MKNVLITGANKGIGFETAKQLAQLDYTVYLGSRDESRGMEAIRRLKDLGIPNAKLLLIDVTRIESIREARQELEGRIEMLDLLINNAAIAGGQPQHFATIDMKDLRKVFETNFFGTVQTTQQFLPLLERSPGPMIINVSSELGSLTRHSSPQRNSNWDLYDAYGSSKTALNAFTVALANAYRDTKFRINSVTPGYSATDLNGFVGTQTAEQGARYIVNFATRGADAPTGNFVKEQPLAW